MAALLDHVSAFCTRYALLSPGDVVVVGVSGGADSLCLLHVLRELAPRWSLRLHVAHLDHQLRLESADDARFVAEIAQAWSLPISQGREDVAAFTRTTHTGIEAAARELRHRFLIATAQAIGAQAIALGHTADDQAETVLLRLLRGAGPHGLAAMRPQRPAYHTPADPTPRRASIPRIIRPLLETTRAEVEAYCVERQLDPRHDSSNDSPEYTRNRVRGYIMPLLKTYNANIVTTLGRTARICAEEDELLDDLVDQLWPTLATVDTHCVQLDRQRLRQTHRALQRRIIQRAAALVAPEIELAAKHIDLALAAIGAAPGAMPRRVQLPQGLWLHLGRDRVQLTASAEMV
jgi:tRNA(Ile)-lysidine synthase